MQRDTSTPAETFEFTGQSFGAAVPTAGSLIVLDTNVMSILERVARNGFRSGDIQDRRAAHFLKWAHARGNDKIFTLFGVLEGASFHAGGVSSYQMLRRGAATGALVAWARDHIDEIVQTGKPLPKEAWRNLVAEADPALETARSLLPLTVLPCYVASLAAVAACRSQGSPLEKAQVVHDRLATSLDYIPAFGWLSSALLFLGRGPVRNELRTSVYKVKDEDCRSRNLRRSCLSAAWDLGYLELMSIARAPTFRDVFEGRQPVLVTDDRGLVRAASHAHYHGNTGFFTVEFAHFDRRWRDEAVALFKHNQVTRFFSRERSAPDWDRCAAAAKALEVELGLDDAPVLALEPPVRRVEVQTGDIQAYLYALECPTADLALDRLVECDGDALLGGIVLVERLVVDNANVRARTLSDSWDALISRLGPEACDLEMVQLAIQLPRALGEENWRHFNALVGKLQVEGGQGLVVLWLWRLGRLVLEDTAVPRGTGAQELVALLRSKVSSVEE